MYDKVTLHKARISLDEDRGIGKNNCGVENDEEETMVTTISTAIITTQRMEVTMMEWSNGNKERKNSGKARKG